MDETLVLLFGADMLGVLAELHGVGILHGKRGARESGRGHTPTTEHAGLHCLLDACAMNEN